VGDIDQMSERALEILRDDNKLKEFKKTAAAHAHKFDIHNIIPLYEKLYDDVLSKETVSSF
jgi:L-malate glycosyltransferase